MLFLVKLFPEITIKTRTVRWRLICKLRKNIRSVLSEFDPAVSAAGKWDNLEIQTSTDDPAVIAQISESLTCTSGIAKFMQVEKYPRTDLDAMLGLALEYYREKLVGKDLRRPLQAQRQAYFQIYRCGASFRYRAYRLY